MDYLTQLFIPAAIWFQNIPGWVISIMKGITFLGSIEFYLLFIPILYWCMDTILGIRIGIILLLSGGINSIAKFAFHSPRPFWATSQVKGLVGEVSFGFPSGHAQNAASIWGLLAAARKKFWITIAALVIIFLIGLSRLILGAHFIHDVLGGWLLGTILLFLFLGLENKIVSWFKPSPVWKQFLLLGLITLLMILLAFPFSPPLNPPIIPDNWILETNRETNPYSYNDLLTAAGSFFGLGIGIILLNKSGFFKREGKLWQLVLRYLVGVSGTILLYAGLGAIFPDELNTASYLLRFIRYSLVGFWVSYGAPQVFAWLNLTGFETT